MNVVIFGATGMVGAGVLLECFADPRVTSVLAITRSPTGRTHSKLHEVVHQDFFNFESLRADFASCDACFFCLGITSLGLSEAAYTRVTYDIAMAAAREMVAANPLMTFCFVSGVGTDSTERGRTMWARVKGKTENALLALGFNAAFMFRPGYIQPIGDVESKTGWVQTAYDIARHYRDEIVPLRKTMAEENLLRYNGMLIGVFELLAEMREQITSVMAAINAQQQFWLADAALAATVIGKPTSH